MANDGWHDFDFFHGKWRVEHRRLTERLAVSTEWQEFSGVCTCQPTLGSRGNFDDNLLDFPEGAYRAVTVRSFDGETGKWSIWWLDGRRPGQLDVPVIGQFDGDVGTFFAMDVHLGRDVLVRFQWHRGLAPTWEQALSADEGQSWEVNWTMQFTRDETVTL